MKKLLLIGKIVLGIVLSNSAYSFEQSDLLKCSATASRCAQGDIATSGMEADRAAVVSVSADIPIVKTVLFGTNRKLSGIGEESNLQSISRAFTDELSDGLIIGRVEQHIFRKNGNPIINTSHIDFFNSSESLRIYIDYLEQSNKLSRFLYIHGVNNTFMSAVRSATSISDSKNPSIVPIAFSWPSKKWTIVDSLSTRGYDHDRARNEESIPSLSAFISKLNAVGLNNLDIFAHSRGSYLAARYLERIFNRGNILGLVESVSLAAPDINSIMFYDLLGEMVSTMDFPLTLYISDDDKVITLSQWKNFCTNIQNSVGTNDLNNIDVINVNSDTITGHDFHTSNPRVGEDYREWLLDRRRASERRWLVLTNESERRFSLRLP